METSRYIVLSIAAARARPHDGEKPKDGILNLHSTPHSRRKQSKKQSWMPFAVSAEHTERQRWNGLIISSDAECASTRGS